MYYSGNDLERYLGYIDWLQVFISAVPSYTSWKPQNEKCWLVTSGALHPN